MKQTINMAADIVDSIVQMNNDESIPSRYMGDMGYFLFEFSMEFPLDERKIPVIDMVLSATSVLDDFKAWSGTDIAEVLNGMKQEFLDK